MQEWCRIPHHKVFSPWKLPDGNLNLTPQVVKCVVREPKKALPCSTSHMPYLNNNKDWIQRVTCQRIGIKYSNKEYRQHSRPRQRWSSDLRGESVINGLLLECSFEFDLDWAESRQGWSFTDNFFLLLTMASQSQGHFPFHQNFWDFRQRKEWYRNFLEKSSRKSGNCGISEKRTIQPKIPESQRNHIERKFM